MALIPPFFLDCVVALGVKNNDTKTSWVGTGFLYARLNKIEKEERLYNVFLVTNKHVLGDKKNVLVRFNPQDNKPSEDYNIILVNKNNKPLWTGHPDVDIATIMIDFQFLIDRKIQFQCFRSDKHMHCVKDLKKEGISEGDGIFVLGFPMGLVDNERQYVICRSGSIARIRDLLDNRSKDFLVDAFVFPGNSGGPVITKPESMHIRGTTSIKKASLIGIVQSYIPYQDVAISPQTKRPRIVFEENSGLSSVIPVDYIKETVEICFEKTKKDKNKTTKI